MFLSKNAARQLRLSHQVMLEEFPIIKDLFNHNNSIAHIRMIENWCDQVHKLGAELMHEFLEEQNRSNVQDPILKVQSGFLSALNFELDNYIKQHNKLAISSSLITKIIQSNPQLVSINYSTSYKCFENIGYQLAILQSRLQNYNEALFAGSWQEDNSKEPDWLQSSELNSVFKSGGADNA